MDKMQALHSFWKGFGIPAFDENSVPDESERISLYGQSYPYLTYEASSNYFDHPVPQVVSLFYRSTNWTGVTDKEREISEFIGRGGRVVTYDGGAMWIKRDEDSTWAQRMGDQADNMIKRIVLNTQVEFFE